MKLIAVFFVVVLAGAFAQDSSEWGEDLANSTATSDGATQGGASPAGTTPSATTEGPVVGSTDASASPVPAGSTTVGPTQPDGSTAIPASTTVGPTVPPQSTVSGQTDAPTESTGAPVTTVPTEPPTTTIPLNRNVSFNVNCVEGTSCKFTFTIDERLVRSINNTALEVVLSQLSTSINNASPILDQLGYDEETYSQYIIKKIDEAKIQADFISGQYNETQTEVESLSEQTASAFQTAQNYLKSAVCFQTDGDSSIGCGQLADLSY